MGAKHIYTVKSVEGNTTSFAVTKFDEDINPIETYYVSELGPDHANLICNCFAGARFEGCRHRKMLRLFQAEGRVDSGWFYHFDKQKWIEPITTESPADIEAAIEAMMNRSE